MRDLIRYANIALLGLAMRAGADGIPEIRIPCGGEAPLIDGIVTDACWSAAALLDEFHQVRGGSGAVPRHQVRVLRDCRWLYAAFTVDQPEDQRDPPVYDKHDQPIQREDNVQVSFDPGTDGQLFYQFLVNKANTRADFRMTKAKGREREEWNIPWKSAVTTDPRGWQVEIALPLALLTEVGQPGQARMNFIIDCFLVERDDCRVKMGVQRDYRTWAPLTGSSPANAWTEAKQFGCPIDFELDGIIAPVLPYIKEAAISRYYTTNGAVFYNVNTELLLFSSAKGAAILAVSDKQGEGEAKLIEQIVPIDGNVMRLPVCVPVPVEEMAERAVTVRLLDGATREVWQTLAIADLSALNLFSAYLDRDYYTTEQSAVAICRINLPKDELQGMRLVARLGKEELAVMENLQATTRFAVPLQAVPVGGQVLRLELVSAAGASGSSVELCLSKQAPRPGCEWKVDRENYRLLENGRPFFPLFMVMGGIKPSDEYAFAEMAQAGFNTMLQWTYRPDGDRSNPEGDQVKDIVAYLDAAARHGLKVIAAPDMNYVPFNERTMVKDPGKLLTPAELAAVNREFNRETCSLGINCKDVILSAIPGREAQVKTAVLMEYLDNQMPYLTPIIQTAMNHPALAAFFIFDEPLANIEYGQIPVGREFYRRIKTMDGYHPVFVNWNPGIYQCPDEWFDWMDMLGIDPYWTPEYSGGSGTIDYVAWMIHHLTKKAERLRTVPTVIMQGAEYSGILKRALTPAEQICQTYLALIHGAKGIGYFCYPERAQVNWDTLRELARRMKLLGPICLEPAVLQEVAYADGPYDFDARQMPDVQVSLKRNPAGGFVLLAASVANRPVAVQYELSLLAKGGVASELFSNSEYQVTDGGFTDTIEPLGVRAYRLLPAKAEEFTAISEANPVTITVAMSPQGELPPPAIAYGRQGRIKMKNLAPNPSFEEESVPGRPDYWRQTGSQLKPWERMGGTNQVWGLTANDPYHGKKCFEMISENGVWRFVYFTLHTEHRIPEKYVFSVWLRSDRDGAIVRLRAGKSGDIPFKVTREWQRYSLPFDAGAGGSMLGVHIASTEKTTVWVDALQVERGEKATEFEP